MSDKEVGSRRCTARWLAAPAVATMFLTRLPVRAPQVELSDAVAAFPLVGALVGGVGGAVYWLATLADLPPLACALLALAATAILTGAMHEDGLADSADGLAGRTADDSIRIMRDSRTGGYGVLAMVFSVSLRATAIAALGDPLTVLMAMATVGAVSRAAMPAVMLALPRASSTGLGAAAGKPVAVDVLAGILIAVLLVLVMLEIAGAVSVLVAVVVASFAVAALARRRLGGYTGDVLGALQQLSEITSLLTLAAVM